MWPLTMGAGGVSAIGIVCDRNFGAMPLIWVTPGPAPWLRGAASSVGRIVRPHAPTAVRTVLRHRRGTPPYVKGLICLCEFLFRWGRDREASSPPRKRCRANDFA